MIQTFANKLLYLAIFLLPWQTQWILGTTLVSGEPSGYGVFGIYVVEVMILFAFLLRGSSRANERVRRSWRGIYFFLGVSFFSLTFSLVSGVGWFHMMHVLSAALLYVCVTDERTDLKKSLVYFLCGLSVPILIGWEQVLSGSSPDSSVLGMAAKDAGTAGVAVVETVSGRLMRAYGTFPHPNIFGGYVAFGFIGLAWLARFVRTRVQLAGALLGSVLLAGTLLVTFSRSAWLGLLIAFLLLVGVMYLQKKTPSRKGFSIILLGGLTFLSTLLLFHTQVFSRFNPSERLEIISIQERASQYQTFGQVFEASPLLGVGPGAYTFMLEHLNPDQPVWFYQPIHNTFLLILGELGVVGFIFLFYLIFSLNPIANADVKSAGGVFAMMGGILFFEIALFDHYLWSLWPGLALIALGSGCIAHWMFTKDIA